MVSGFSITYETVTPESAEHGEAASLGYELDACTFGEAYSFLRNSGAIGCHCEADCYPISTSCPPRWLTFYDVSEDFCTGEVTSYSIHFPENATPASRLRIARLFDCYGVK